MLLRSMLEGGREAALDSACEALFAGPGEMRALYRAFDWSRTSVGPVDEWPVSLRNIVRTMLASRHPMFLWWGPDLVQIYNDAYRPSFGQEGRHLRAVGAKGAEFWTEIWDIIGPQIEQVMSGGEATWHEDQLVPIERNGRIEDVWWTYGYSPAFDDAGCIAGVLVVCQETTARVLAERELQLLNRKLEVERSRLAYTFQQAPSFLAILRGKPLTFEFANEAYYQLVGHRDLIGRGLFEAIPDARGQGFEELLDTVLETGNAFVGREIPIFLSRSPGAPAEERVLDFVYFPLIEADGSRSGVIAHGVDVTDHVRAKRESERARAEAEAARSVAESARAAERTAREAAEKANRSKSEFLAVMSHELRTPLNAIDGYAELMELGVHGSLSEEQRQDLARIRKSQRHLLGLINGVLNYARIEAGALRYDMRDVVVDDILAGCEALVAPQAHARGLSLRRTPCPPELAVRGDPEKIQQVVLNLLSNAIKFTDAGGTITLGCQVVDRYAHIVVSDSGRGISAEHLARIFEPFVQVDARLIRTTDGVGLGLAISRDLARGMGGDLTVDSRLGVGSTFTLAVPRAP